MELNFTDPPKSVHSGRRPAIVTPEVVAALKARPGEWALLGRYSTSMVGNIRRRDVGVEATSRNAKDGKADLYVRWVGEQA